MKYLTLTKEEYAHMCENAVPPTRFIKSLPGAFITGGAICALGEMLAFILEESGFLKDEAYLLSSLFLIFASSILTGLGVFDKLSKIGGAGTLIPITGFSNAVTSPALEFKREGFILGTCVKMFSVAGPVIVSGLLASFIYGIIVYIF